MIPEHIHQQELEFVMAGEKLIAHASKVLFWPSQSMLILSDLHLGKAGHFRKHGIPIPKQIHRDDLDTLDQMIAYFAPKTVLFLGDLFHSAYNDEWMDFGQWSADHQDLDQILVKGNHDVLNQNHMDHTRLRVMDSLLVGPFHFTHEPNPGNYCNVAGHIHPGVKLQMGSRQSLNLPCFYLAEHQLILPSFGKFTGKNASKPARGIRYLAISDKSILEIIG